MAGRDENQDDDLDTSLGEDQDDVEDAEDDEGESKGPVKADGTPYTQADIDALQTALRKSRKDARSARRGGPGKPSDENDEAPDPEKARAEAESAAEAKWKPTVVRTAARAAFAEAGLVLPKGKADAAMARALRLLDVDELEINEDGDVDGLDEQIEDIRADFPDLFTAPQKKPGRVDAADRGSGGGQKRGTADLIASQLLGTR